MAGLVILPAAEVGDVVMRRKPAAHSFGLKVGIQPFGKLLILRGVADESGVELEGLADEPSDVLSDEDVGNTCSAQEDLGMCPPDL